MTTSENPSPQDSGEPNPGEDGEGAAERVDPQDALRGLENQPRIDEHGHPTAYTAVPPPLRAQGQATPQQQQQQGQGQDREQPWQPPQPGQAAQQQQSGQPGQPQPQYGQPPQYGQQAAGQNPYPRQPGYGYPPPPPGYNEPYGAPYGGGPVPGMPPYANWGQRVAAWLIDNFAALVGISLLDVAYYDWSTGPRLTSWVITIAGVLWAIYNAYLAGQTGQSAGKRILGIRLARYVDGQVVGPAFGVLRLFMNVVFWAVCAVPGVLNYLWPLWDRRSQTWSDKIASSVVVRAR